MGEVVMSCEGDEVAREVEMERFMPPAVLSVLLVEADDSTRQVIAALLKKCGYKVAAVSDGLKAWEVLTGNPSSVDLVLTEVELPSIAGFALLTLIMEHDSCKNIPVIMMSSNDSVNMVYKCMLRGAADFLVKPVRKNELQNLWQHVWRRQNQKAQGLSDDCLPINLSNGACTPENEECNEKGNDAQSSCSVPQLEAESVYTETIDGNSKKKVNKLMSCEAELGEEECVMGDFVARKPKSSFKAPEDAVMVIQHEDPGGVKRREECNATGEASDNNDLIINASREAFDLIGNFQDRSFKSCINPSVITSSTKFESCPQLDLSLRRYDESQGNQNIKVDERSHAVHQSNASAFSRYIANQPSHSTQANTCHQTMEFGESLDNKHIASPVQPNNVDAVTELRQGETSFYCPQARILPVTVPVKKVRLDRACPSNGSSLHRSYYQTGATPDSSPDSAGPKDAFSRATQVTGPNSSSCSNQKIVRQELNFDTAEHMRNVSPANERSQNSSLYNGTLTRLNSSGGGGSACGSNGSSNGNLTTQSKADGVSTHEENINRSLQREAALIKFRQKRKDRCFEKKVRYESRKKLAEQRPRVKGQFVRQVPIDVSAITTAEVQ